MPDPSAAPAVPGAEPAPAGGPACPAGPVAEGDLVISWYDDKPVAYGGDTDNGFAELSFGLLSGGPPVRKCPPGQVAPADVPIPDRDPRVSVTKRTRADMPYGAAGIWQLTLPGRQHGSWHRTKRDATAAGLRQVAILDWHAARAAQAPSG
jgi:hypothetical protein